MHGATIKMDGFICKWHRSTVFPCVVAVCMRFSTDTEKYN